MWLLRSLAAFWSTGYEVFPLLMFILSAFPQPDMSVMRKTCFTPKTRLSEADWKHTLFVSSDHILSGSAVVMGPSIVLLLVIRSIDWTRAQLSVNLCREAEDTISLRRKERYKQGWSRGRDDVLMPDLVSEKEHGFPNIAMWPEDLVFRRPNSS